MGRNLPARRDDQPLDPPVVLRTAVRPQQLLAPPDPLPQAVDFGGLFSLLEVEVVHEGQEIVVTSWWAARQRIAEDYTLFVHLRDQDGQLLAQADGPPNDGLSPTRIWQAGDVIRDVRRLPAASSEGGTLLFGAYAALSGERLPAALSAQALPDNSYVISVTP